MTTTRRLAAIMAADVVGFSAAMERDEEGTFAQVQELRRKIIEPKIEEHTGRLVKTTGDGFLAEFASPITALRCALAIQAELASNPLKLRVGLNLGDVIVEANGDVYGEGVNVAARLEALADPGGILISAKVHAEVEGKVEAAFEDLGEQKVKNIARLVRVFQIQQPSIRSATSQVDRPSTPRKSIMVLPLLNIGGDPEQEYFADGLTENLTTDLSRFRGLFVIGRNTAFTFKGKTVDLKQIGRELNVRYVLEGSVQRGGDRIRINVQLIETDTGGHLWAERFDRPRADLFKVQDEIARHVAWSLSLQLNKADLRERERSDNPDSVDLVLRTQAAALGGTRPDRLATRFGLLQRAVQLDHRNGDAWALMAANRAVFVFAGWSKAPADDLRLARDASERALAIDPHNPAALFAKGQVFLAHRDYAAALESYEHAREANPSHPNYHQLVGVALIALGRSEEAFEPLQEALRISPRDLYLADYYMCLGSACWHLERYSEAQRWLERSIAQNSRIEGTHFLLASSQLRLGAPAKAATTIATLLKASPGWTLDRVRAIPYSISREAGDQLIEDLKTAGLPE